MRRIRMINVNVFVVKYIFHLRFKVASLTRKSKIMNKIISKIVFDGDRTFFIPSNKSMKHVETIEVNQKIDTCEMIVMPSDLIKEMIKKADDIVIMDKCLCRSSTDCKDYPQDLGCIFLGKTTHKISRNFCRDATQEEAIEHIDKCNQAGLMHIIGKNKMDTLWMNVRPGDELLTICNCCPCCCLWKVYPCLSDQIQADFFKLDTLSVECDNNKCIKCLQCIDVCFGKAISLVDDKIVIDDNCIGCGQCSGRCPVNAINISYEHDDIISKLEEVVKI